MFDQDGVNILNELGLTINQARIYMALSKYTHLTAMQLSKQTNISTEVIYREMPKLQNKGLVQKIITYPQEFSAIPLQEALSMLIERVENKSAYVRAQSALLLSRLEEKKKGKTEEREMILVPPGKYLLAFNLKKIEKLKESLDVCISSGQLYYWFLSMENTNRQFLPKNIKIRFVIEKTEKIEELQQKLSARSKSRIEYRFYPTVLSTYVSIYDNKEAMIRSKVDGNFLSAPSFCSANMSIIELAKSYFESKWRMAHHYNTRNLEKNGKKQLVDGKM